ncbi:MAG: hypothetical protein J7K40_05430 [candidate division Zixibacteria bacterium]|nr:hypothetical protein [candidate division Zixibacteria bacterium]
MSYCMANHFPEGDEEYCDIYLYGDSETDTIICMGCPMNGNEDVSFTRRSDAIKHLEMHRARGDPAPYNRVIDKLKEEIETEGDEIHFGC